MSDEWGSVDENLEWMRQRQNPMLSYYYSFDPTGNVYIDRILAAVATAGKAFHHTKDWGDDMWPETIQRVAEEAAKALPAPPTDKPEEG